MLRTVNENTKNDFLTKFGKHIKQLRKARHLSQSELAERCRSNIKKIGRTERGEYDFKISSLIVLAKGLNVDIKELLDFEYPEDLFENFWIDNPDF